MIIANLSEYGDPLCGLMPGADAQLVAVADDHDTITALAQLAERPAIIELPTSNRYGLYRLFSLSVPAAQRGRL